MSKDEIEYQRDDVVSYDDYTKLIFVNSNGTLKDPVRVYNKVAEAFVNEEYTLCRDSQKGHHALINKVRHYCPIYYYVGMIHGRIPWNDGPEYNDFFCVFLDGNINNDVLKNMKFYKITGKFLKIKEEVETFYKLNQKRGSRQAVHDAWLTELKKDSNNNNDDIIESYIDDLSKAVIDSNLYNVWEKLPTKVKEKIKKEAKKSFKESKYKSKVYTEEDILDEKVVNKEEASKIYDDLMTIREDEELKYSKTSNRK